MKRISLTLFVLFASCSAWALEDGPMDILAPYHHNTCQISAYVHFNVVSQTSFGVTDMYHINYDVEHFLRTKEYHPVTKAPSSSVMQLSVTVYVNNTNKNYDAIMVNIFDQTKLVYDLHYMRRDNSGFGKIGSTIETDGINRAINKFLLQDMETHLRQCQIEKSSTAKHEEFDPVTDPITGDPVTDPLTSSIYVGDYHLLH